MCVFSADTVVKSTKILSAKLTETRQLLAYSNGVTTGPGGSVMMLPIPTNETVVFHDTTPYKDFLDNISAMTFSAQTKGMRGAGDDFTQVGVYRMKMVHPSEVINSLQELEQPIQKWMPRMIENYVGYTWLFVIIPEGRDLNGQPLLIEFEQTLKPGQLYVPLMDVHGNEHPSRNINRNHIVTLGDKEFVADYFEVNIPKFLWNNLKYKGIQMGMIGSDEFQNADLFAVPNVTETDSHTYRWELSAPYFN